MQRPDAPAANECRYCGEDAVGQDALGRWACKRHIEEVGEDTSAREGVAAIEQREWLRPVLDAENALSQAIYLADWHAEKLSRDHPSSPDFVTHYVVAHGLWAAVLRERQNLRYAIQTTCWPDRKPA